MSRTKMISATFTNEEYATIEKAANMTDRNLAGLVRWATIKHLREIALLPYPGESEEEQGDE